MQTYSNLLKPWRMQQFSRFQKSYNELREMLKKGSQSQSKKFFLLTLLEFIVAIIVIGIGSQVTKLTGLYLNEIDKVITIVALLITFYLIGMDYLVDLHAVVDPQLTVKEGHDIAHALKDHLIEKIDGVGNVFIHIEPYMSEMDALSETNAT